MSKKEEIKLLIEQRLIEATKKKIGQKLIRIAKTLGKPIIAQTAFGNHNFWETEEGIIYDPSTPYEFDEWETSEQGFYFDGLTWGINLCITILLYDNKVCELKTTYNGYVVFAEIDSDLQAYAPFPTWEKAVDMFNDAAIEIEKKRESEKRKEKKLEHTIKANNFWKKFRMMWGY